MVTTRSGAKRKKSHRKLTVTKCLHSKTALIKMKKAGVQRIAGKWRVATHWASSKRPLLKKTLIAKILVAEKEHVGIRSGKHVGHHLRKHKSQKCRSAK